MNPQLFAALRRGRFSEAERFIDGSLGSSPEELVTSLEITYYLGDLTKASSTGSLLQRTITNKKLLSRVLTILASAAWDCGDLEHAVSLSKNAHHASLETQDSVLISRSAADLLERTCNECAFSASLPLSGL